MICVSACHICITASCFGCGSLSRWGALVSEVGLCYQHTNMNPSPRMCVYRVPLIAIHVNDTIEDSCHEQNVWLQSMCIGPGHESNHDFDYDTRCPRTASTWSGIYVSRPLNQVSIAAMSCDRNPNVFAIIVATPSPISRHLIGCSTAWHVLWMCGPLLHATSFSLICCMQHFVFIHCASWFTRHNVVLVAKCFPRGWRVINSLVWIHMWVLPKSCFVFYINKHQKLRIQNQMLKITNPFANLEGANVWLLTKALRLNSSCIAEICQLQPSICHLLS